MARRHYITADELFRPIPMTCVVCGAGAVAYPDDKQGVMVCPHCSPKWLDSFARFRMNEIRKQHGLQPV